MTAPAPAPCTAAHTPGPWEYVPSTEHHGPYVESSVGGTICDCYVMSNPSAPSVRNGGDSKPISFFHEMADPNARLIASAPDLLSIAKRWLALDAGSWHPVRYARERAELLADTQAAIAKAEPQS